MNEDGMTSETIAMQYRQDGVALRVLRESGIDFTGDRLIDNEVVVEAPRDAATRMAEMIAAHNPEGLGLLRAVGMEIPSHL